MYNNNFIIGGIILLVVVLAYFYFKKSDKDNVDILKKYLDETYGKKSQNLKAVQNPDQIKKLTLICDTYKKHRENIKNKFGKELCELSCDFNKDSYNSIINKSSNNLPCFYKANNYNLEPELVNYLGFMLFENVNQGGFFVFNYDSTKNTITLTTDIYNMIKGINGCNIPPPPPIKETPPPIDKQSMTTITYEEFITYLKPLFDTIKCKESENMQCTGTCSGPVPV